MPSLCPGEAQPEAGWMGALGQWLGWGEDGGLQGGGSVSGETKSCCIHCGQKEGLERGSAPLTSCSGWRILAGSWDIRVRFSSRAGKTQSRWRPAPLLVGDLGPIHQAPLLADSQLPTSRKGPGSRAWRWGRRISPPPFSNPRHPLTFPSLPGKQTDHGCNTISGPPGPPTSGAPAASLPWRL